MLTAPLLVEVEWSANWLRMQPDPMIPAMLKTIRMLAVVIVSLTVPTLSAQTTQPSGPRPGALSGGKARLQDQAAATKSMIQTIRSQMELYRLQHNDKYPTLAQLSDWRVLTQHTNEAGDVVNDAGNGAQVFGPYLQAAPQNPFTGLSKVSSPDAIDATTGWAMKPENGSPRLYAVVPEQPALHAVLSHQDAVFSDQVPMAVPVTAPAGSATRSSSVAQAPVAAGSILQTVRAQNELYKLMHRGQPPSLADVAQWRVFLIQTNEDGKAPSAGERTMGPYLQSAPVNPLTGHSKVVEIGKPSADAGWTYDQKRGRFLLIAPADLVLPHDLAADDVERLTSSGHKEVSP